MSALALIEKRRKAAKEIPKIENILRGSMVMVERRCGKPGCRCVKGFKHRSLYLSQSNNGESRLIYIPKRSEKQVRRLICNYQALKSAMEKISRINMELLTA